MSRHDLWVFKNKRVLLLQGPVGPFFFRLAKDLRRAGATVSKVNFNGGDTLFYPLGAITFRGTPEEWPAFFGSLLEDLRIDIVILFGDNRPLHRVAHALAQEAYLEIGVFEEGYLRPDYISFERFGANANSLLPRDPEFYLQQPIPHVERPLRVGNVFWYAMTWAMLYNTVSSILHPFFPQYRHHRTLTIWEGISWLRAFWRKPIYALRERGLLEKFKGKLSKRYYLVPLQLKNDAQIIVHSDFGTVETFIEYVIASFAAHAPRASYLVIKQHPFDRGFNEYSSLIEDFARKHKVASRVLYIHDQHLPTLLRNTLGVVAINSTVGMSALVHKIPLKACGEAIYDMEGLTFQGPLDEFWVKVQPPSSELYDHFRTTLIHRTQINGNFYRRLPIPDSKTGIAWDYVRGHHHRRLPQKTKKNLGKL